MRRLNVSLAERSYPILIGAGLLSRIDLILPHLGTPRVALITNTTVAPLYMNLLLRGLEGAGVGVTPVIIPDGEAYKNWESLNLIYDALLANRCDRSTTIIALGGGGIGGLARFAGHWRGPRQQLRRPGPADPQTQRRARRGCRRGS